MICFNVSQHIVFHYEKKTKQKLLSYIIMNFLKNILLENYLEFANRFLNKDAEVETRVPCKVGETQFIWLRVYFFWKIWVCPG